MKMSNLFGRTLREAPAEADGASYRLMVRAGLIKRVSSGIFSYSPMLWRVVKKVERIIREEMDSIGGQEVSLPVVQPAELWQESGRLQSVDSALVRFEDRAGRNMVLAMTHEEAVTDMVRREGISHRQLPFMLYQIQTKFRDEPRARGGLIRVREFLMKDAYSFHASEEDLHGFYDIVAQAYRNIFRRLELPALEVASDVGMMGGMGAHEFQYVAPIGEDSLATCPGCGYAANLDAVSFTRAKSQSVTLASQEVVSTPNCKDIAAVASFFGIETCAVLKTLAFFTKGEIVLASLRGDTELDWKRLENVLHDTEVRMATEDELMLAGLVPGYLSPHGVLHLRCFLDIAAFEEGSLVAGANLHGKHTTGVRPRELTHCIVTELSLADEGSLCVHCGQSLALSRGVEVGNIFKLGTKYSSSMGATYVDASGNKEHLVMGCYGIGVGRTIACIVEEHHDERGIIWPMSVAPYHVHLVYIGKGEARDTADSLYSTLLASGVEVLYDDRELTAGVKFSDMDLLGIPIQVVVSKRSLDAGGVEVRSRKHGNPRIVKIADIISIVPAIPCSLQHSLPSEMPVGPGKGTQHLSL